MKKLAYMGFSGLCLIAALSVQPAIADYKQAVIYYNQGNYEKAIQELKPDIEKNPDWEFGHRLLGLCYLNLNNNALAQSSLQRAVELNSTAFSTYYGLGQAYFNMQKYEDCISALNRGEPLVAKEKDPEKEKAKLCKLRGAAYYRLGQYKEAADDLTNALRVNQSDWADFSMLGISYFKLDRTDEAIQALGKALAMKPGQKTTTEVLGDIYLKKGTEALSAKRYPAAVQALLKAKEYTPQNGYIYYNLAEAYLFEKKYSDAEKALLQSADLIPKNPDVYRRMGLVYEKQKKWKLALNAYEKANAINQSKSTDEAIARVKHNMQ
jgi:tetratricopeptide (TPR) repeat protein